MKVTPTTNRGAGKRGRATKQPKPTPGGPRFSRVGFYVEGIHFPGTVLGLECASAYGAKLVREYEWIEEDKPYREFLLPAAVLNACARVELVSADKEPLAKHTRLLLERARGRPA